MLSIVEALGKICNVGSRRRNWIKQRNKWDHNVSGSESLEFFFILIKKYMYECKMTEKLPQSTEFKQKLNFQCKIENCVNKMKKIIRHMQSYE